MEVKIDTKEKFHVITLTEPILSVNIAADLTQIVTKFLHEKIKSVVLNLSHIETIDQDAAEELSQLQQWFYENDASFVICSLKPEAEKQLDDYELLEMMNLTPTESEAYDIVQMEEIERELLDEEE